MEEKKDNKELNERIENLNNQLNYILLANEISSILNYKNDILDHLIKHNDGTVITIMQDVFINYVCIRICAIWEEPTKGHDEKSIPSIIKLINHNKTKDDYLLNHINRTYNIIIKCKILKQMKNHRNKHIAHTLEETRTEKTTKDRETLRLQYGFESKIIKYTSKILNDINIYINKENISPDLTAEEGRSLAKAFFGKLCKK